LRQQIPHRHRTLARTLADGENAPRERSEKLFGTVSEITPVGVKFKNRTNSRSQTAGYSDSSTTNANRRRDWASTPLMALWRQQRCCFDHRAALIFATT
jgi:hypothetical protein